MKKVTVLTDNSLLTQGLISRLHEYSCLLELTIVDLAAPNPLKQVADTEPDIIIFDEGDFKNLSRGFLTDLLNSAPQAAVFALRLDSPKVRMIQSIQFNAANVDELVQILKTGSSTV